MSNMSPIIWFFKTCSKWILFFLFTVWIFILGILVGRETAPINTERKDLKQELAELKLAHLEQEDSRIQEEAKHVLEPEELGFFQELKESAKPVRAVPQPGAIIENKKPVAAKSVTEDNRQLVEPVVKAHPVPQPPSVTPGLTWETAKMSIQVASFRDMKAAETRAEELKLKGFDAYVSAGEVANKGTWFRVRVGFFNKQEEAKPTLDRLKRENISGFMTNIHSD